MRWSPRRGRSAEDPFAAGRAAMVERQLRGRGVTDERVLAAMGAVPRERFVPVELRSHAYDDAALPIEGGQAISQPYIVAWMTELLQVLPGGIVLEIGTGSGYQAAVLATIGARVRSIERLPELAAAARERLAGLGLGDLVEVIVADGSLGDPGTAPHARVIVTAGAPTIPTPLIDQLADGGRLVVPVGPRSNQELILVTRASGRLTETPVGGCAFVPLIGAAGFRPGEDGPV